MLPPNDQPMALATVPTVCPPSQQQHQPTALANGSPTSADGVSHGSQRLAQPSANRDNTPGYRHLALAAVLG